MRQSPEDFRAMQAARDAERDDDPMPFLSTRALLAILGLFVLGSWVLGAWAFVQLQG